MKRLLAVLVIALAAVSLQAAGTPAATEVSFSLLKAAPEKFKSKLICYSEVFQDFSNTFPPYIENSGFKSTRWFLLFIGDQKVPVLIKKKDDITALVADLKPGATLVVTGRVREFKVDPMMPMFAKHYVEAESLVRVAGDAKEEKGRAPQGIRPPLRQMRQQPVPPSAPAAQPPPF